jgi:hypothetical protein
MRSGRFLCQTRVYRYRRASLSGSTIIRPMIIMFLALFAHETAGPVMPVHSFILFNCAFMFINV